MRAHPGRDEPESTAGGLHEAGGGRDGGAVPAKAGRFIGVRGYAGCDPAPGNTSPGTHAYHMTAR
ncbi:hypothetical protein [Streptomyces pacificus]|uniref:Uncharacterized protein n=1 Tax=Streptomyces pacificus TaxID=2705029 RepID=A0A6A0AN49_9ACTN|nr:hypothetical protein [Streptomyces pacificus]GFH34399.1 hypothetical protein SCWH03_06130 [Streptomyces pacificus]